MRSICLMYNTQLAWVCKEIEKALLLCHILYHMNHNNCYIMIELDIEWMLTNLKTNAILVGVNCSIIFVNLFLFSQRNTGKQQAN